MTRGRSVPWVRGLKIAAIGGKGRRPLDVPQGGSFCGSVISASARFAPPSGAQTRRSPSTSAASRFTPISSCRSSSTASSS